MERTIIHIVGGESRSRAEQARVVFALGHHAEVYSDLEELFDRPPQGGIIMVADEGAPASAGGLIAQLAEKGIWLPLVMAAADPSVEQVVVAIKTGALDYLQLPLEMSNFAGRLSALTVEASRYADQRRREVEARNAIGLLSKRERQVLELLSAGCANKEIARRLAISPRTVEIHRGNMMGKLGAGHLADAVHLWVDSQPAGWTPPMPDAEQATRAEVAGRIDRDAGHDAYAEVRRHRQ